MALWQSWGSTPVSWGWERSSRDVNSIGGTGYAGYSYFWRFQGDGRERHDREGLLSSSSSSSAEGCLWERRLYRVRAVWIQTCLSSAGRGPPEISEDQKLIPDLPRATPQLSLYDYPRTSYHRRFLSWRKGIGAALSPRTLLPLAAILKWMH